MHLCWYCISLSSFSSFLFQCLAVVVLMGTQQLKATLLDQVVSARAQVLSALPQANKKEMVQKGKGRQREMSTPATGKRLCFHFQKSHICCAGSLFVEEWTVGAEVHGMGFVTLDSKNQKLILCLKQNRANCCCKVPPFVHSPCNITLKCNVSHKTAAFTKWWKNWYEPIKQKNH